MKNNQLRGPVDCEFTLEILPHLTRYFDRHPWTKRVTKKEIRLVYPNLLQMIQFCGIKQVHVYRNIPYSDKTKSKKGFYKKKVGATYTLNGITLKSGEYLDISIRLHGTYIDMLSNKVHTNSKLIIRAFQKLNKKCKEK